EGHMSRQCTQPKRRRNAAWFKDKAMLAEAQEATEDLDTYDSGCDDISNAKAVLLDNISNYGSDVISEVPHFEIYPNDDMENQSVHALQDFEQSPVMDFIDNEIISEGHMARQCTQPKRPRNAAWYKDKAMLAEAHEYEHVLDEEQLGFLADPGF
nr:retrovirus-related Pol polyprotein from transposon TNT 1-94 [Tanacetum cinerariifolium]GFB31460.1 retrovirus-related Pol polyprotein from transposon TNT 1-94 [Tanacetum cinerariifolium]